MCWETFILETWKILLYLTFSLRHFKKQDSGTNKCTKFHKQLLDYCVQGKKNIIHVIMLFSVYIPDPKNDACEENTCVLGNPCF